jgi:HSF-type DNA-binding
MSVQVAAHPSCPVHQPNQGPCINNENNIINSNSNHSGNAVQLMWHPASAFVPVPDTNRRVTPLPAGGLSPNYGAPPPRSDPPAERMHQFYAHHRVSKEAATYRTSRAFPVVLHRFVQRSSVEHPDLVHWSPDGCLFYIASIEHEVKLSEIIAETFKHGRFTSLRRQMNQYGFKIWTKATNFTTGMLRGYWYLAGFRQNSSYQELDKISRIPKGADRSGRVKAQVKGKALGAKKQKIKNQPKSNGPKTPRTLKKLPEFSSSAKIVTFAPDTGKIDKPESRKAGLGKKPIITIDEAAPTPGMELVGTPLNSMQQKDGNEASLLELFSLEDLQAILGRNDSLMEFRENEQALATLATAATAVANLPSPSKSDWFFPSSPGAVKMTVAKDKIWKLGLPSPIVSTAVGVVKFPENGSLISVFDKNPWTPLTARNSGASGDSEIHEMPSTPVSSNRMKADVGWPTEFSFPEPQATPLFDTSSRKSNVPMGSFTPIDIQKLPDLTKATCASPMDESLNLHIIDALAFTPGAVQQESSESLLTPFSDSLEESKVMLVFSPSPIAVHGQSRVLDSATFTVSGAMTHSACSE